MPRWADPRGIQWSSQAWPDYSCLRIVRPRLTNGSRRMFVCVSAERFPELVLHVRWKLSTETCNASLTQYYLEMKLVDFGLVALLWSYGVIYVRLLTLTAVFCCRESVEEQAAYKGLLCNLVVPSVPQGRQWAEVNRDNQDIEGTQATSVSRPQSQRDLV